jgi:hypothetical protein
MEKPCKMQGKKRVAGESTRKKRRERYSTLPYDYRASAHYPPFGILYKTQFNSIGLSYLTGNTLRLRYNPNSLMLTIGL